MNVCIIMIQSSIHPMVGNGILYPFVNTPPLKARDVDTPIDASSSLITWSPYTISFGMEPHKSFDVYVFVDESNTVFMKPMRPYLSAEFETLFGFSIGCANYDEKKVVQITYPLCYNEYFNT